MTEIPFNFKRIPTMDGEIVGVRVKSHNKKTKKDTLAIVVHVKMDDTQVFPFSRFGKVKLIWEAEECQK